MIRKAKTLFAVVLSLLFVYQSAPGITPPPPPQLPQLGQFLPDSIWTTVASNTNLNISGVPGSVQYFKVPNSAQTPIVDIQTAGLMFGSGTITITVGRALQPAFPALGAGFSWKPYYAEKFSSGSSGYTYFCVRSNASFAGTLRVSLLGIDG